MPKLHLQSENNKALCGWPWINSEQNRDIINDSSINDWLVTSLKQVKCSKCIKKYIKTGCRNESGIKSDEQAWIIKLADKKTIFYLKEFSTNSQNFHFSTTSELTGSKIYYEVSDALKIIESLKSNNQKPSLVKI